MYEELFRDGDIRKDTGHSDIFAAVSSEAGSMLSEEQLQGLKHLSTDGDITMMLGKIKELIPAYTGWPRKSRIENLRSGRKRGRRRKGDRLL